MRRLASTILCAASFLGLTALPSQATDLLSHRAAYRLSLLNSDAGIDAVKGGLVIEWQAACDGWISNQRLGFVASGADSDQDFSYDVRFSSWESRDNRQLRFSIRSFEDDKLRDEFKGKAELESLGGTGQAHFERPDDQQLALPSGTLFPTEHVRRLIAAAEAGQHFVSNQVFDGSGGKGLTQITAVIGKPKEVSATDDDPTKLANWPMSLAYYSSDEPNEGPDFEANFDLAENGVIRDMRMNYGNFVIKADLERIELLPVPSCN